jgi:hypothetical protein
MVIGMIILAMCLTTTLWNRSMYSHDLVRTRLNQNLRSALDIVGITIREAGENLVSTFPALEIVDGASGAPDEVVLRRSLIPEVLNFCQNIASGTNNADIYFANSLGTIAACDYASNQHNFTVWQSERALQAGNLIAYAFDPITRNGEFINISAETDTGSEYYLTRSAGTWQNNYTAGIGAVYILEEWRFRVQNNYLQLIQDGDTANPLNVAFGITDFQVTLSMADGTTLTSFAAVDNWSQIRTVNITLIGNDALPKGQIINSSLTSNFFLRNILSN